MDAFKAERPLFALLADAVRDRPSATAVIYRGQELSYLGLAAAASHLVRVFSAQGLQKGQRVGLSMSSSPLAIASLFALARIGACILPLSTSRSQASRLELAKKFGISLCIADDPIQALPGYSLWLPKPIVLSPQDLQATEDAMRRAPLAQETNQSQLPWFIVLSSGSTGVPKGVALTQAQAWVRIRQCPMHWDSQSRVMPYDLAIGAGLFPALRALAAGGTVVVTEDSDFQAGFAAHVNRYRATHVMSSPWMAEQLLKQLTAANATLALPSVQRYWVAGGHCSRAVLEGLMQRATPHVWVVYASVETGIVSAGPAHELLSQAGLCGKLGNWVQARTLGDGGQALPEGSSGLLSFASEGWPTAYAHEDDNQDAPFDQGWYRSKDYGRVTAQGQLFVDGRAEGLLNIAGMRIDAQQLEQELIKKFALSECAVFAALLADRSSQLCVALRQSESVQDAHLESFLHEQMATHTDLSVRVIRMQAIPRTGFDKIARRELQLKYSVSA